MLNSNADQCRKVKFTLKKVKTCVDSMSSSWFCTQFEPEQSEGLKLWQQILEGLLQHHRYLLNVLIHWFKGLNPTKVIIIYKKKYT